jgi:hypothetical protein
LKADESCSDIIPPAVQARRLQQQRHIHSYLLPTDFLDRLVQARMQWIHL